jgi:hypothetical protein
MVRVHTSAICLLPRRKNIRQVKRVERERQETKKYKNKQPKSPNNGKHYNDVSCSLKVLRLSCCTRDDENQDDKDMKRTEKLS